MLCRRSFVFAKNILLFLQLYSLHVIAKPDSVLDFYHIFEVIVCLQLHCFDCNLTFLEQKKLLRSISLNYLFILMLIKFLQTLEILQLHDEY